MRFKKLLPFTAGLDEAGSLTIAGHSLDGLADQYGTPLYVYDGFTIQEQARRLRDQLQRQYPGEFEITYAAKAYFSLGMARKLAKLDLGVDVVSLGEMAVARRAGFPPERIHLHGNNKSEAELDAALNLGIQAVVVDSLDELEVLEGLAARKQQVCNIWLRISPGVTVNTHAYLQTSHHTSKFGLTTEGEQAAQAVRRALGSPWLQLTGLHTHLGSNFFEPEPYRSAIASLAALGETCEYIPQALSPGGGWGVPYVLDQAEGNPEPWIATVSRAIQDEFGRRKWPLPRLVIEPGRWLMARSGIAVYTVGTTKTAGDGTRFVAVDGGMADNPRPALYDAQYTAFLACQPEAETVQTVRLVGRFCESGDHLISEVQLPEVFRGDRLVTPVAGAYQLSMASNYNLSPRPAVLWLEEGTVQVLQKRERLEESGWWVDEEQGVTS